MVRQSAFEINWPLSKLQLSLPTQQFIVTLKCAAKLQMKNNFSDQISYGFPLFIFKHTYILLQNFLYFHTFKK